MTRSYARSAVLFVLLAPNIGRWQADPRTGTLVVVIIAVAALALSLLLDRRRPRGGDGHGPRSGGPAS